MWRGASGEFSGVLLNRIRGSGSIWEWSVEHIEIHHGGTEDTAFAQSINLCVTFVFSVPLW